MSTYSTYAIALAYSFEIGMPTLAVTYLWQCLYMSGRTLLCHGACIHSLARTHTRTCTQAVQLSKRCKELQREVSDRDKKLELAAKSDKMWAARLEAEIADLRQVCR